MTTPAVQRVRVRFPESHIGILTPEKLSDLWERHPCIDSVIAFAAGESPWAVGRRLRAQNFDTALVLPNSPRSALEILLARIPQRFGYARPWRNWFLTGAIPTRQGQVRMQKLSAGEINRRISAHATRNTDLSRRSQTQADHALVAPKSDVGGSRFTFRDHHIHDYLHLAAALGARDEPIAPNLVVTAEEVEAVAGKFELPQSSAARPIFGLNPGAEYGPAKRWPADRFVAAAREIQKQTNCTWLIFGGKGDMPVASEIYSALLAAPESDEGGRTPHSLPRHSNAAVGALNLAGRTSLRELMALLKVCRMLLTNDSGPMHVAAALGTPVVVPFGSTSPELTGPGLPGENQNRLIRSDAPCSPCFRRDCPIDLRCMTGMSVERIAEAVKQVAVTN
jgi:heptosyltransferase-2